MISALPTYTQFKQSLEALTAILYLHSTELATGKGSVIRELIIRPYAYIHAKLTEFVLSWLSKTSIKYLSTSTATLNEIADAVASNYFVLRKSEIKARGTLTLTFNTAVASVGAGVVFTIDGKNFRTLKTTIASAEPLLDTDTVDYVKMYRGTGAKYRANIHVEADLAGYVLIPVGVEVLCNTYIANVLAILLTSPITGGATAETDADMLSRCKQISGTCIGTLQSIRHKLQQAPINVLSCSVLGTADVGCFRSRYNNLAIAVGGVVDIYAKTANQASLKDIIFNADEIKLLTYTDALTGEQKTRFFVEADSEVDEDIAGMLRVTSVVSDTLSAVGSYTVYYISSDLTLSLQASRLSDTQGFKVVFLQLPADVLNLRVTILYMPGIKILTAFLLEPLQQMLGQDYKVRAAVPVRLSLSLKTRGLDTLETERVTAIKLLMAKVICSKLVGDYTFSVDLLTLAISVLYPLLKLSLPHAIHVSMPMTTGADYTFNSSDGTVDIRFRKALYTWDSKAYFFSCTPLDINILAV